jgi:hypothetical protein
VIEGFLAAAFVADAALMCFEDLRSGSVPMTQALALLFVATLKLSLGGVEFTRSALAPTLGDLVCLLALFTLVARGRTGLADLIFLVSLRIFYPGGVVIERASILVRSGNVIASLAEVSFTNGVLLALRHRVLSARGGRWGSYLMGVPEFAILFAPAVWLLSIRGGDQAERVPFIPFLAGGAIIGASLNTLLL